MNYEAGNVNPKEELRDRVGSSPAPRRNTKEMIDHSNAGLVVAWPETSKKPRRGRRRYRRRVTFDCTVEVKLIELADEFSEEELSTAWYTDKEYKKIKKQAKAIIEYKALLERRAEEATDTQLRLGQKLCDRGLEHIISKAVSASYCAAKDSVIEAVLVEQDRQRRGGGAVHRPRRILGEEGDATAAVEALCLISSISTKRSHDLASSMGEKDAVTAASFRLDKETKALMSKCEAASHQEVVPLAATNPHFTTNTRNHVLKSAFALFHSDAKNSGSIGNESYSLDTNSRPGCSQRAQSEGLPKLPNDFDFPSRTGLAKEGRSRSEGILGKVTSILNDNGSKSGKKSLPEHKKKHTPKLGQALFGRFAAERHHSLPEQL